MELSPTTLKNREACLLHANDLLQAAERVLTDAQLPNIAYHLATLALEEVGKARLIIIRQVSQLRQDEDYVWAEKRLDNHAAKLFCALWSHTLGREVIKPEQIEMYRSLARQIHETRLRGIYVSTGDDQQTMPRDTIKKEDAENLIRLAEARLHIEKFIEYRSQPEGEVSELEWLLTSTTDSEKLRVILGRNSMEKLAELGNVCDWIQWLRKTFEEDEQEIRKFIVSEFKRQPPPKSEEEHDKWRVQVRLVSGSHSIRPKALNWWNERSNWLKLRAVGKNKDQILVDVVLPKAVPLQNLW